jgi:outer membrane receptor for ferrienterochelin and colicins
MKSIFFILNTLLLCAPAMCQSINGKILETNGNPINGALITELNTQSIIAVSDAKGTFRIDSIKISSKIGISAAGFISDTISITGDTMVAITLQEKVFQLEEAVIKDNRTGNYISSREASKLEVITSHELTKAACCDLAGCFETQISVQSQVTNILTNARELRILGLSGVYNQVLTDGFPMINGLSYTYGISTYPGTYIQKIFVAKGANSVIQGFDGITGQINMIIKDKEGAEKVFGNIYLNNFGESQYNFHQSIKKEKVILLTGAHVVQPAMRMDRDQDGFLDMARITRYMIFQKFDFGDAREEGWSCKAGWRMLKEKRIGGQSSFQEGLDEGSTRAYGQTFEALQPEIYTKSGYRDEQGRGIFVFAGGFMQEQDSWFGTLSYKARQYSAYTQIQAELPMGEKNLLRTGISYRHFTLSEDLSFPQNALGRSYAGLYSRVENIPGIYAENTGRFLNDAVTIITGIRADRHQAFGSRVTPRATIKWDISTNDVLRISGGNGWRTVNIFPENISMLASSRDIIFKERLLPERAINSGISYTRNLQYSLFSGAFSLDYYYTRFQNQFFPDYDSAPGKAIIRNFDGRAESHGLQADLGILLLDVLDIKLAYNFLEVIRYEPAKTLMPFNPRNRALAVISYSPVKSWQFDINSHFYGKQRLPNTTGLPDSLRQPGYSRPYQVYNVQATFRKGPWEFYAGCENLLDFRQVRPIVSWQEPFSEWFDTSFIWGPTRGREIYAGIRFIVQHKVN